MSKIWEISVNKISLGEFVIKFVSKFLLKSRLKFNKHLKKVFLNKKSIRFIGNSDKNRLIYELTNF